MQKYKLEKHTCGIAKHFLEAPRSDKMLVKII